MKKVLRLKWENLFLIIATILFIKILYITFIWYISDLKMWLVLIGMIALTIIGYTILKISRKMMIECWKK